jgi:hypothetical protein
MCTQPKTITSTKVDCITLFEKTYDFKITYVNKL